LQERKDEKDQLFASLNQTYVRCNEPDKVNDSLQSEITTLLSEKKAWPEKIVQLDEEARVSLASYEQEVQNDKGIIRKCHETHWILAFGMDEREKQFKPELEEKTSLLT
jgi:hypothetical protein